MYRIDILNATKITYKLVHQVGLSDTNQQNEMWPIVRAAELGRKVIVAERHTRSVRRL